MSLSKDMMAIPLRYDKGGNEVHTEWVKINLRAFEHQEYPSCLACNQKYVPIEKEDIWCFKCKMTIH